MTKILTALAISIFLFQASADSAPDMVFQCGQDFQRELSRISNHEFVLTEGFAKGALESSHAYFYVNNSDLHWSKHKCQIEIRGTRIESPHSRPYGKKLSYKFKFQFLKAAGPASLVFLEDGKPPVGCTVSPQFLSRMKDCQLPTEIPEALACQSQVVDGVQVKTIFRYDPQTGGSERQVYKVSVSSPADAKSAGALPQQKEEDLGTRGTLFRWKKKSHRCEIAIHEKEEDDDHWTDFKIKLDPRKGTHQAGQFEKMRILLDHDHVADLLDNKKKVQCVVSQPILQQAVLCRSLEKPEIRQPAKTGKMKVLKKGK